MLTTAPEMNLQDFLHRKPRLAIDDEFGTKQNGNGLQSTSTI